MTHTEQMLNAHPKGTQVDVSALTRVIDTAFDCAQSCTACADACLGEENVASLRHCIRLDLDCAEVCATTGTVLSRQTEPDWNVVRAQVQACATACQACAAECERHADRHDHCRVCAQACRQCEDACKQLLAELPA